MDLAAAYAAVQASDLPDKAEIAAAFKNQISTVIGEKNAVVAKLTETETVIAAIVEGTKASGATVQEQIKDAAAKVAALTASLTAKDATIAELTTKSTALEAEKTALATKSTLQDVATKTGANVAVLTTLIPDVSKVVVTAGAVTVDGKAWDEWLKSDAVAPFAPALVPVKPGDTKLPTLPTGKAGGDDGKVTSIYDAVRRPAWSPSTPAS